MSPSHRYRQEASQYERKLCLTFDSGMHQIYRHKDDNSLGITILLLIMRRAYRHLWFLHRKLHASNMPQVELLSRPKLFYASYDEGPLNNVNNAEM